jgi:hypothetical protein
MIARHQHEHEAINAHEYPGTRQLCATCNEPTERCEEDAIYTGEGNGPLCVACWHKTPEYLLENGKRVHPYQRRRTSITGFGLYLRENIGTERLVGVATARLVVHWVYWVRLTDEVLIR